ncbi:tol-pal system protein YbgF [Thiohalomonas denitrificans]|uniref:tol-pal system protein YbgF n=1 Tax=Thiohalomonas denitrificans TaxID=415747 RepID=UPI0026E9232E|nr:tol-pal system protein YbgF [Thiohalomonas denitrificans]
MSKLRYLLPALLAFGTSQGAEGSLEQRVQRLERVLASQPLLEMLTRLDQQQRELATLRGTLEEVRHQIENLKEHQRTLYLDTDRRLVRLEREGITSERLEAGAESDIAEPGRPTPDSGELIAEREVYQKAFDILRELRYEPAIAAFEALLKQYPDGRYAHVARYWIGEANYARGEYNRAIGAYRALVDKHPDSPKVAEALLKIGYSYHKLEQNGKSRSILEKLTKTHPGTTEARQAEALLERLEKPNA